MFSFIAYLSACSIDLDNRTLPSGYFQAETIYNDKSFTPRVKKTKVDPFSGLDQTPEQPVATTQQNQLVSLGGVVRSSLPMSSMGSGWTVSSQGSDFLVVHTDSSNEESTPNVLIYGYYDSEAQKNKTLTSRRFISAIDPGMEQSGIWEISPFLFSIFSSMSLKNPLNFDSITSLTNSYQPSMGVGLGYQSNPESFSGWRWVGVNSHNVFLRLGKTTGKFISVQEELKMTLSELRLEDLSLSMEMLNNISSFKDSLYKKSGKPAEMIFGSISYNEQTIYLSVMCIQQPKCQEQESIIAFLNGIQPIQQSDVFSTSLYSDPSNLASTFNLPLFQNSDTSFQSGLGTVQKELEKFKEGNTDGVLSLLNPSSFSQFDDAKEGLKNLIEDKINIPSLDENTPPSEKNAPPSEGDSPPSAPVEDSGDF